MSAAAHFLEEWHGTLGDPQDAAPETVELRKTIIREEFEELMEAMNEGDRPHIAKELADVLYVIYGTARAYDLNLDAALAEVHRSNMTKFIGGVEYREDGKILKGEHFEEADMDVVVAATSWLQSLGGQERSCRLYSPKLEEFWAMTSEAEGREYLEDQESLDLSPTDCILQFCDITTQRGPWKEATTDDDDQAGTS